MNRYGLVIIAVAVALLAAVAWKPARQYVGLQSLLPAEETTPASTPAPTPGPSLTPETALTPEPSPTPTPEAERPRFDKCVDGSALTVTSRDGNQTNYRCESGAIGAYLN